jgi:hypothetical protein
MKLTRKGFLHTCAAAVAGLLGIKAAKSDRIPADVAVLTKFAPESENAQAVGRMLLAPTSAELYHYRRFALGDLISPGDLEADAYKEADPWGIHAQYRALKGR